MTFGRFIEEFFIITFMNKFIAIVLLICTIAFANEDGVVPEVDRKRQISDHYGFLQVHPIMLFWETT